MSTSNANNETTINPSSLPTAEYLYARNPALRDSKNTISYTQFDKIVRSIEPSAYQQLRLIELCEMYNALTREQQVAQDEPHLSAEDDFAIFTDQNGFTIIQHEPTFIKFKLMGYESVEMKRPRRLSIIL